MSANNQDLSLKTAWPLDGHLKFGFLCGKSAKKTRLCFVINNYVISVCNRFWALSMTRYWPYVVRPSNICAKLLHTLEYLQRARSEKMKKNCLFLRKHLTYIDFLKARGWLGHTLAASASPRTSTKILADTLFRWSWRSVPNSETFEYR